MLNIRTSTGVPLTLNVDYRYDSDGDNVMKTTIIMTFSTPAHPKGGGPRVRVWVGWGHIFVFFSPQAQTSRATFENSDVARHLSQQYFDILEHSNARVSECGSRR